MLAYYSLAAGAVEHADAPLRVGKGLARHPIPVMLLARLAVDLTWQGRGLGKALVKDALLRTAAAADIAGIRALLVHAKDDEARGWYEALEFEPSPHGSLSPVLAHEGPAGDVEPRPMNWGDNLTLVGRFAAR